MTSEENTIPQSNGSHLADKNGISKLKNETDVTQHVAGEGGDSLYLLNGRHDDEKDHGQEEKEDKEIEEEEEKEEEDVLVSGGVVIEEVDDSNALDGGYGWFVVFGAFMAWVLAAGFLKSGGLLLLRFQEKFDTGALKASWPGSILSLLQSLVGPLVAAVCNRYSVRTSVMIGTTLLFVGLILNSVAEDFYFLFFCHSFLQGVGMGFMLTPVLFIVSSYFDKRRGFAVSLASSGGGVGTFLLVPFINFLFDFYGFQGSFLLLAAMLSQGFVVAMLFRPFRMHQTMCRVRSKKKEHVALCDADDTIDKHGDSSLIPLKEVTNQDSNPLAEISLGEHASTTAITTQSGSKSRPNSPPCCNTSCFLELKSCLKTCFPTEHKRKGNDEKRKIFHFNLLKEFSFVLFLSSTFLFTIGMKATYMFIPAACVDKGLTKSDAALVLSISGAVDTFGRIGTGFLFDLSALKPFRAMFFSFCLIGIGLAGFFIPFLESFVAMTVVCTILGVFFGAHVSQRAVVLVDLMGKELLPSCMGLIRLFQAFAMLFGPLIFGALRDSTGNYNTAFFVSSTIMLVSGVIMVLSNVVYRIQRQKSHVEQPA